MFYLVFRKLVCLTRGGQVPDSDRLVVGEADDGFPISQKLRPVRHVLVTLERAKQSFRRHAQDPNFSVIAADRQELTVGPESSTVSGLPELGEALVHFVRVRVEDLDLEHHCRKEMSGRYC